jgi:hypothetical protein
MISFKIYKHENNYAGIEPHVTLHNYDLPQALEDEYEGWLSRDVMYVPFFYRVGIVMNKIWRGTLKSRKKISQLILQLLTKLRIMT